MVAKRAGEREPQLPARVRAAVDVGQGWRPHASPGSRRVYDTRLVGQREEARRLRYRLRLKAAHDREAESYRVRRRGWDRRYGGYGEVYDDEVGKADRKRKRSLRRERQRVELGPLRVDRRSLVWARPTAGDAAARIISSAGVPRLALAGAGGALAAEVASAERSSERAKERAKAAGRAMIGLPEKQGDPMSKSLVEVSKSMPESWDRLDDIEKFGWGTLKTWGSQAKQAASPYVKPQSSGGRLFDIDPSTGAFSLTDEGKKLGTRVGTAAGVAGGAAGAVKAGKWLMGRAAEPLKAKARKYALYGAGGIAGSAALGSMAGNMATNR